MKCRAAIVPIRIPVAKKIFVFFLGFLMWMRVIAIRIVKATIPIMEFDIPKVLLY